MEDMSRAGARGKCPGDFCRDLLRSLSKGSQWPCFYWAQIPVLVDGIERLEWHPFLLAHETRQPWWTATLMLCRPLFTSRWFTHACRLKWCSEPQGFKRILQGFWLWGSMEMVFLMLPI